MILAKADAVNKCANCDEEKRVLQKHVSGLGRNTAQLTAEKDQNYNRTAQSRMQTAKGRSRSQVISDEGCAKISGDYEREEQVGARN